MIPFTQSKLIEMKDLSPKERFQWLVSSVLPRPIAWVSTRSLAGVHNIAPFSFYSACSGNPPCVSVAVTYRQDGLPKDTLRNAEETKEFVVNLSSEGYETAINDSSGEFPPEVDEFQRCGLKPLPSKLVQAPRVAESPLSMECIWKASLPLGDRQPGSTVLIIGEVVAIHVDPKMLSPESGMPDPSLLKPLSRLGGAFWAKMTQPFELKRPRDN